MALCFSGASVHGADDGPTPETVVTAPTMHGFAGILHLLESDPALQPDGRRPFTNLDASTPAPERTVLV